MIPYTQTTEDCLKEMFRRVGKDYPHPITKWPDWYTRCSWSEQEQDNFDAWMRVLLKKRYHWPKKKLDWEVGMFLLQWGWKTESELPNSIDIMETSIDPER